MTETMTPEHAAAQRALVNLASSNENLHMRIEEMRIEHENRLRSALARDAVAVAAMVDLGVTIGEPVAPDSSGCRSCVWHLHNHLVGAEDGAPAYVLLTNLREGYYGEPSDCVIRPVTR